MLLRTNLIIFSAFIFFVSCSSIGKKENNENPGSDTIRFFTGLDLQPQISKADSAQVLFYNNPYGDPDRYTRYFTLLSTKDSSLIHLVLKNLDKPFSEQQQVRNCRSEGKMYLFERGGIDPLQTIYFATSCDTCCYLYYIRNGSFYYFELDKATQNILLSNKTKAKKLSGKK